MKLKVITLNVWHGGKLWDNVIEFLKREDPDILLLQEVFNEHDASLDRRFRTMDLFKNSFDFVDSDFAPTCKFVWPEGNFDIGNAIFSKFPIIKRFEPVFFNNPYTDHYEDVPGNYQNEPRNLEHVIVDVDGRELDVLNLQGTWDLNGDNNSLERHQMGQAMIDAAKDRPLVVMGGDTNARPTAQAIRDVGEHLTNVFGFELKSTFNVARKDNPTLKAGYAESVVDMLFVSPDIKVVEKYCPDVDVSDHFPLVMTIELPGTA